MATRRDHMCLWRHRLELPWRGFPCMPDNSSMLQQGWSWKAQTLWYSLYSSWMYKPLLQQIERCSLWQAAAEKQKPIEEIWLQMFKRADPPVNAQSRVYSKHFLQSDYISCGKFAESGEYMSVLTSRLKPDAILPKCIWLHIHDIVSASNAWPAF